MRRATEQSVRRFFFTERGKHFLLVGVPYAWLANAPAQYEELEHKKCA